MSFRTYRAVDHLLLWGLITPALLYAFWTKWTVVNTHLPLSLLSLADLLRLHAGYYLGALLWCLLMLRPAPGLPVVRLITLILVLLFVAMDLSSSATIFYTGTLAPYDAAYYAASAIDALPFSIATTEWLTLVILPLVYLGLALWKLRQCRQQDGFRPGGGLRATVAVAVLGCVVPPQAPGLEQNLGHPSWIYQIMAFGSRLSIWPQAMALELQEPPAPAPLTLTPVSDRTPPNLVIIALESVGAQATGPYNPARRAVTPFLNELAETSWLAEHAYAVVPHTSKALVSINCGILPYLKHPIFESTHGTEQPCLAALLRDQGYRTAFFQSPTEHFENRRALTQRMGFTDFMAGEQLEPTGFQLANYFGYEDNILLEPAVQWIRGQQPPFFVFYLTGTTHHPYWVPQRYGHHTFDKDNRELNDYLNAVHYLDHFLKALIAQYKAAGLYDNTVFVIVGDHGESFGDLHSRRQHNASLYQEVMRVPLLIHAPALIQGAPRVPLVSQIDLLPTLLSLLGFQWQGELEGFNALAGTSPREFAVGSCWYDDWCIASADSRFKFIHNFGEKPDELYDLLQDPQEQHNIIEQHPEQAAARRRALLTLLEANERHWHRYLSRTSPNYWALRNETLGTPGRLLRLPEDDPRRETAP